MSVYRPELTIQGAQAMPGDCQLEARFVFAAPDDMARGTECLAEACAVLAQAGRLGAFPLSRHGRHAPDLSASATVRIDDRQAGVLFAASNLDPKAFQCLRNMLGELARLDVLLAAIRVTVRGSGGERVVRVPEVDTANESVAYPACVVTPVDFEFVWADSQFSKSRRVLLEFGAEPPRDLPARLAPWLQAWYRLLEMGAFSTPFGLPFETESQRGQLSLFDRTSYEISVSRYVSSEAGFRVLANMLAHFNAHRSAPDFVPIARVEVD